MRGETLDGQEWITFNNSVARDRRTKHKTFNNTNKLSIIHCEMVLTGKSLCSEGIPKWLQTRVPMPILYSEKAISVFSLRYSASGGFQKRFLLRDNCFLPESRNDHGEVCILSKIESLHCNKICRRAWTFLEDLFHAYQINHEHIAKIETSSLYNAKK